MKEIILPADVVLDMKSIVSHMATLKHFYVCFIDDSSKKFNYLEELIKCKLDYESKVNQILITYGLNKIKCNWSLDFNTGKLSYE